MQIEKKEYIINENEKIDVLEIIGDDAIKFYSYNYKIKNNGKWKLYLRWDNFQKQPHIDRFDGAGNLVESTQSREKTLKEVVELVNIFGKNLVSMNLERV